MRDTMLILHFIGLAMGVGTAFAHAFLGAATSKMPSEEATKFNLNTLALSRMGNIGLVLLIVSGIYLLLPYWNSILSLSFLMLKLVLVVVLTILIGMISILGQKALKSHQPEIQFNQMELLGKIALTVSIAIVIVAVRVFH
ncbi:MAG TPA: hypothetical protein VLZ75_04895 [Chitinophagales bacterium]|nr:hypothetical protein [Chitinophagales bacterium]